MFEFVNTTGTVQIDQENRNRIRAQVMRDFYKKKSLPPPPTPSSTTPNESHLQNASSTSRTSIPAVAAAADSPTRHMGRFRILGPAYRLRPKKLEKADAPTKSKSATTHKRPSSKWALQHPSHSENPKNAAAKTPVMVIHDEPSPESETPLLYQNLAVLSPLPAPNSDRVQAWVHHYFNDRKKSARLMLTIRKSFFQLAMQDTAFYVVSLGHYAGIFSLVTKQGDPEDSFVLRTRAIGIVNSQLGKADLQLSDGIVAAVASMVIYETSNGTRFASLTHLAGLEKMVKMRGGIRNAGFAPTIQRLISWAELIAVCVLSHKPRIVPFESPGLELPSTHFPSLMESDIHSQLLAWNAQPSNYDIDWAQIDTDIANIFADLRFLSFVLRSHPSFSIPRLEPLWYSDKVYLAYRSLAYISMQPGPTHSELDTASCIAAAIYVDSCLRDLGILSAAVGVLLSRLRTSLEEILPRLIPRGFRVCENSHRVLWMLTFGSVAALWRKEHLWFVEQLANACQILKLGSWWELQAILEEMLWDPEWEVYPGYVWEEVEKRWAESGNFGGG